MNICINRGSFIYSACTENQHYWTVQARQVLQEMHCTACSTQIPEMLFLGKKARHSLTSLGWNNTEIKTGDLSEIFKFSKGLVFPKLMKHPSGLAEVNTESNTALGVGKAEISNSQNMLQHTTHLFIPC